MSSVVEISKIKFRSTVRDFLISETLYWLIQINQKLETGSREFYYMFEKSMYNRRFDNL